VEGSRCEQHIPGDTEEKYRRQVRSKDSQVKTQLVL